MGVISSSVINTIATTASATQTSSTQIARTAKALVLPNTPNVNITDLRNSISTGNTCTAENINTVINFINSMIGHYHTYDDNWQLATFGNNGDRGSYFGDKNTSTATGFPATIGTVDTNTVITAAKHNEMAGACRTMREHSHVIDDRVSL